MCVVYVYDACRSQAFQQLVATNFAFVTISSPRNISSSRTRVHALSVNSLRATTQIIAEQGRRERDALQPPFSTTAQITPSSFTPLFRRPTATDGSPSATKCRAGSRLRAYLALQETAARLKSHQKVKLLLGSKFLGELSAVTSRREIPAVLSQWRCLPM